MDASTSAGRQRSPGRKEKRQPLSEQELPSSFRDARPVCRPWSSSSRAATARVGGSIVAAAAYMAGDRPRDGMVSRVRRRPCPQGLASRSNAILVWHVDVPHARRNDIRRARTVVPALGGIFKRRAVEFLGPAAVVSHKSLSHNKIRSRTICDSVTHAFCSSRFDHEFESLVHLASGVCRYSEANACHTPPGTGPIAHLRPFLQVCNGPRPLRRSGSKWRCRHCSVRGSISDSERACFGPSFWRCSALWLPCDTCGICRSDWGVVTSDSSVMERLAS